MDFKRSKEKSVAVADIGGGSAALGLLALPSSGPARLIAAERSVLTLEERSTEATIAGIGEELEKAAAAVQKKYAEAVHAGLPPVSELYAIIRAPWARSKTMHVRSVFEADMPITGAMIGKLAKQALSDEQELDHSNMLEASIVRVEINGYPTGAPEGKRGHEISVFAVVSDCNAVIRTEVAASLQKLFPHVVLAFCSSMRALVSVLRARPGAESDYVVMEVTSEGSALMAVREGIAVEHALISEGVRTIVKRISQSGMPEETLSLLRMLARDECESAACNAIRDSMGKIEPDLVRLFAEGMGSAAVRRRLPGTLVLVVHPDLAPWLAKFFSRIDFSQFTQTAQPFKVFQLLPQELREQVIAENGVPLDSGLALAAALVNIERARL